MAAIPVSDELHAVFKIHLLQRPMNLLVPSKQTQPNMLLMHNTFQMPTEDCIAQLFQRGMRVVLLRYILVRRQ